MKRFLCWILALMLVFACSSCQMLEKFISAEPSGEPTATTPSSNMPEETAPQGNTPEATSPAETTPAEDSKETGTRDPLVEEPTAPPQITPNETTPESGSSCNTTPAVTTPAPDETVLPDQEIYFSVQVVFQSGGIHRVEETLVVKESCTFHQLYALFVEKHYLETFTLIPYLNGELIDTNKTYYLQDGDFIYLEEYSGMPGEEPVCTHHWIDGWCQKCGTVCNHNEWNDNRQCIVCGFWMGVNMLEIEIYEDGEYRYYTQNIEITVHDLVMSYFGYPWDYMASVYEFYYNGMLISDGSYLIVESGRLDLVTRNYYE